MANPSKSQREANERDVVRVIQAMQVLFGEDKVARYALTESLVQDRDSMLPLGLIMGALVRSHYRELVLRTVAGG